MKKNKYLDRQKEIGKYYQMIYPWINQTGLNYPVPGFSLEEITMPDFSTDILPNDVSLKTKIGPVELNFGALTAVMDTVCGPELAKVVFETGGCGILDRSPEAETQLDWLKQVLDHKPCLISQPHTLPPYAPLSQAEDINKKYGISTIPVLQKGKLEGIIFTGPIIWENHRHEPVSKWMKPMDELNKINPEVQFDAINDIMLNSRKRDSVLPVIDNDGLFHGMYFAKDFRNLDPTFYNNKPVVGVAIGERVEELEFVQAALKMGVSVVVIDSSHGDSRAILEQAKRLVNINTNYGAAVIVGNYASIRGYLDFAEIAGIDAVKLGIGSGAICTTTEGTGVGVPIFTALQESVYVQRHRQKEGKKAPVIIVDGAVDVPGKIVICSAGGASGFMAGKYFVAAKESLSYINGDIQEYEDGQYVLYRGMASREAIKTRRAKRYSEGKTAPEGKSGYVKVRGPLKSWIGKDKELIKNGFSHVWARNLEEIHQYGELRFSLRSITPSGKNQIETRIRDAF